MCALAQTNTASTALDKIVQAKIQGFAGRVSIYAKNLDSGATYTLRAAGRNEHGYYLDLRATHTCTSYMVCTNA